MTGPLRGIKVVEMVGIGPGPFCAMMLADMGAEVIRIDKKGTRANARFDVLARGRRSVALDLKNSEAQLVALELIAQADALIEGFRPGVMERLNLGPDCCLERNPRLGYGRMPGWGQTGPLAHAAGHDINYIALSGMLHAMGRAHEPPSPPLNLVGDFGGGAMFLAFGIVCALLEARESKRGQIIDAAMTDGSALLGTLMYGLKAAGRWSVTRGANLLDGGAHFYDTYECADGKYLALGAIEPQFYAELLKRIGIDDASLQKQMDAQAWPELKKKIAHCIKGKTRDEWCRLLEGTDACVAPVLDMNEAPLHAHNRARNAFVDVETVTQPAPAPRFSRTPAQIQRPPASPGEHTESVLRDWGFGDERVARLKATGVI
ncbi:MAG TPA: CaiB/BaiF CoA-transferase family protein [Steroidobacteraceae bacterium]|nr:CaiB/BaiF CoA-transferase family protein [Steroidobacteraceae bacterium]